MTAYYNENDKKAAAGLRELIKQGLIADGFVDDRSIIDVKAEEIKGYTQYHFFAGIGGWSYALRLAGWADDRPVCTASLPCQPFSVAGKGKGNADDRHLLPHFLELVRECGFNTIFGEQVENAIKHGWACDLQTSLETENYTVGLIVLGAHSVGAYQKRQRMFWVAHANEVGCKERAQDSRQKKRTSARTESYCANDGGLAGSKQFEGIERCNLAVQRGRENNREQTGLGSIFDELESSSCTRLQKLDRERYELPGLAASGMACCMVLTNGSGSQQGRQFFEAAGYGDTVEPTGSNGGMDCPEITERERNSGKVINRRRLEQAGRSGIWDNPDWVYCRDGKYRPIKRGLEPCIVKMADGLPGTVVPGVDTGLPSNADYTQEARVMRLKGYGNAIVPQVAAEFIKAFMDILP